MRFIHLPFSNLIGQNVTAMVQCCTGTWSTAHAQPAGPCTLLKDNKYLASTQQVSCKYIYKPKMFRTFIQVIISINTNEITSCHSTYNGIIS